MGLFKKLDEKLTSEKSVRQQKDCLNLFIFAFIGMLFFGMFLGFSSGGFWTYFSFCLTMLGISIYVRWRTRAKKTQDQNKNSMVDDGTDERS